MASTRILLRSVAVAKGARARRRRNKLGSFTGLIGLNLHEGRSRTLCAPNLRNPADVNRLAERPAKHFIL